MVNTATILQGINTLAYLRLLKNQSTEKAELIPFRTSLDFDPKRDSKTTETSDGIIPKNGSLSTSLKMDFINNISNVSDDIQESLYDNEKVEVWIVQRQRKNAQGQFYAYYMRGYVTEASNSNDPSDNSKISATFTIEGVPQRGWLTLPADAQAELNYVFRGIDVTAGDSDDGNGVAWKDADRGTGAQSSDSTGKSGLGK